MLESNIIVLLWASNQDKIYFYFEIFVFIVLWFIELTVNNDCVSTFIECFTAIYIPEICLCIHINYWFFLHALFNQELFQVLSFFYFVRVMNYSFLKQLPKLVCSYACLQNNDVRTKMYLARWNKYLKGQSIITRILYSATPLFWIWSWGYKLSSNVFVIVFYRLRLKNTSNILNSARVVLHVCFVWI